MLKNIIVVILQIILDNFLILLIPDGQDRFHTVMSSVVSHMLLHLAINLTINK